MTDPRVSVVVVSFERRRMLTECLRSVAAARPDEVIVADDGTEGFSVPRVVAFALYPHTRYGIVQNPPLTVEERLTAKRQGELINRAFAEATGDIYTLICDDDLVDPDWYDTLRAVWRREPQRELVRGTWQQFNDGEVIRGDEPSCAMDGRQLTAGNFAWHASLTRDRGVQWPTDLQNCLDNGFLWSCQAHGVSQFTVPCVGRAGYRREHPLANGWFADGRGRHTEAFRAVLESGKLE